MQDEIVEYPETEPDDQSLDYSSTNEMSLEIIESTEHSQENTLITFQNLTSSRNIAHETEKENPGIQNKDEFSQRSIDNDASTTIFSQYLAEKLNQFDPRTKSILIHKINELIFETEMNKYSGYST